MVRIVLYRSTHPRPFKCLVELLYKSLVHLFSMYHDGKYACVLVPQGLRQGHKVLVRAQQHHGRFGVSANKVVDFLDDLNVCTVLVASGDVGKLEANGRQLELNSW
jgi:hypothetical protein